MIRCDQAENCCSKEIGMRGTSDVPHALCLSPVQMQGTGSDSESERSELTGRWLVFKRFPNQQQYAPACLRKQRPPPCKQAQVESVGTCSIAGRPSYQQGWQQHYAVHAHSICVLLRAPRTNFHSILMRALVRLVESKAAPS